MTTKIKYTMDYMAYILYQTMKHNINCPAYEALGQNKDLNAICDKCRNGQENCPEYTEMEG